MHAQGEHVGGVIRRVVGQGGQVADRDALSSEELCKDMGNVRCVEAYDVYGVAHMGFTGGGRLAARHVQAHVVLGGELAQSEFEATDAIPASGDEHGCAAAAAEADHAGIMEGALVLRDGASDALNEVEAVFAKEGDGEISLHGFLGWILFEFTRRRSFVKPSTKRMFGCAFSTGFGGYLVLA